MSKKYEFVKGDSIVTHYGILTRIRALRDLDTVSKGELGGYIALEYNLSHEGECWVADDAHVGGYAQVCGNAIVTRNAIVKDYASVGGEAYVSGQAQIKGRAVVEDLASVLGSACVDEVAIVRGDAEVHGSVLGISIVEDSVVVEERGLVYGESHLSGSLIVPSGTVVYDGVFVVAPDGARHTLELRADKLKSDLA